MESYKKKKVWAEVLDCDKELFKNKRSHVHRACLLQHCRGAQCTHAVRVPRVVPNMVTL